MLSWDESFVFYDEKLFKYEKRRRPFLSLFLSAQKVVEKVIILRKSVELSAFLCL